MNNSHTNTPHTQLHTVIISHLCSLGMQISCQIHAMESNTHLFLHGNNLCLFIAKGISASQLAGYIIYSS